MPMWVNLRSGCDAIACPPRNDVLDDFGPPTTSPVKVFRDTGSETAGGRPTVCARTCRWRPRAALDDTPVAAADCRSAVRVPVRHHRGHAHDSALAARVDRKSSACALPGAAEFRRHRVCAWRLHRAWRAQCLDRLLGGRPIPRRGMSQIHLLLTSNRCSEPEVGTSNTLLPPTIDYGPTATEEDN